MSGKRRMRAKQLAAKAAAPKAAAAIEEPIKTEAPKPKAKAKPKSRVRKMASKVIKSKEK